MPEENRGSKNLQAMIAPRLSVLMVASMCHPDRGSEPGLGWKWASRIARHHDVTVITGEYDGNKDAIRRELAADHSLARAMRFEYVPWFENSRPKWLQVLTSVFQPLYYVAYQGWMREAREVAKRLVAEGNHFDLSHQLTMIGFREPGFLWEFSMPFVWGPVGGTQNVPWRFLPSLGFIEGARHGARTLVNEWQKRFHRRSRLAFRRASAVIAVASDTREEVRRHHHVQSRVIAAALCDSEQSGRRVRTPHQGPCRFVFSGLHVSRKGLPFALRAFARLAPSIEWTLDVMGQGPLSASWRRLAMRLGLGSRVTFHGHVPRTDLMNTLQQADVYVFPSLLEGWPAAIAEALSLGLPVVTTDLHGMRDMVTSRCGRLVPARSSPQLIEDLSQAFRELACDPALVQQLSQGALERAAELSAEVQVPLILDVYAEAIARGGRGSQPVA